MSVQPVLQEEEEEEEEEMAQQFKPFGTPPAFDIEEYRDSFDIWQKKWEIFITLSTINTALPQADRKLYKAHTLLSCFSTATLQAVLSMGLTEDELRDDDAVIKKLKERCNAGRNSHVWRQKFAQCKQRENQAVDDWLCDLRDLARKCNFTEDCCNNCETTRILGQIIAGVYADEVRVDLLKKEKLTLDDALNSARSYEEANSQATNIRNGGSSSQVQQVHKSRHKKAKDAKMFDKKTEKNVGGRFTNKPADSRKGGCHRCGSSRRCEKEKCPAYDKECSKCGKMNHFKKSLSFRATRRRDSSASTQGLRRYVT